MEPAEGRPGSCGGVAGCGGGTEVFGLIFDCNMVSDELVIATTSDDCGSEPTSMRYPTGRNALNPWIREGWP